MNNIVIWKRPDNTYYFKVIKGLSSNYPIGFINGYDHEVVLVIKHKDINFHFATIEIIPFYKLVARFLIKQLEKIAK